MKNLGDTAILAGGCFWCLEAAFLRVPGVLACEPGYCGGSGSKPSYEAVCTGKTGYAEVVRVQFDPGELSFERLLVLFFAMHNPTTLNRQGHDVGTQYRSAIFYCDEAQRQSAHNFLLAEQKNYMHTVVTSLEPVHNYHAAEDYHHRYFENNPHQPYCMAVILPKLQGLQQQGLIATRAG